MQSLLNKNSIILLLIGVSSLIVFGYFISRDNELGLFSVYGVLIGMFLYAYPFWDIKNKINLNFKQIVFLAIAFRLVLLFMTPNLSDDYYRFIWDGNIISSGNNPYEFTPNNQEFNSIKDKIALKDRTFVGNEAFPDGMNSKNYYSVYPPVNQVIFGVSSFFAGNDNWSNILFLRIIIIAFDLGVIIQLASLLKWFSKKKELIIIYALNPLVITELTGNLHFEGVTIFFLLAAILLLLKHKYLQSGLIYSLAIGTKLIPLILLPVFLFKLNWKRLIIFYTTIALFTLLLFLPFTEINLLDTFGTSVQLYFRSFEFNASIYYIFREIGYYFTGYNQIALIGSISQFIVFVVVILIAVRGRKNKTIQSSFKSFSWILLIYYSFASIIHPWYVIYLVAFSVFTNLRFPLVWSIVVILSYFAYRDVGIVSENYLLLAIEYTFLIVAIFWDLRKTKKLTYHSMGDDLR